MSLNHPIVEQSFAIIDREIGKHNLNPSEYAISRRVIHTTADFDYLNLLEFKHNGISSALVALQNGIPIVTDVTMVKQGIKTLVGKTFNNPIIAAIDFADVALPGKTRTETGLLKCWSKYPDAVYVIGNAPTALIALCECLKKQNKIIPPLIIGAPVGFVSVIESKQALKQLEIPQIIVKGRKGGSPVAAAIVNALLVLAKEG
ncbi:Cobalt-precorrin-8 methylmutase [Hyella patelloides LEGE 07179]|uniref:Cobalt-precorrin-8 methylmutase n=1 Tax=Hyella patelloides LEGE 07179 TaxID=945734 RepID=A0A563VR97_9CYAN|nr:cobalt-precorrin-8X methylmutase [Hyella patelloides]VEP13931.1 Cobalt-precorrin-8 methylmutase [Hyella patelloides LEGE 07179]